ncbi:MAG: glycosyltransferase family 39 protein [Acidobacteriota bacterium]|nr:glycosyltransferase family 39 protein [Acidobacteriota bacterium]MDQ5871143.1 glycosyltransferase family 39 protein [Acidobacteriota bacterium]
MGPLSPTERVLLFALCLLLVVVWLELPGSWLMEPDEGRYAEIPREMVANGDLVTPRLNGEAYLDKPPLLYWANAASFHFFGQTPWAARLPARLAGTGIALLLLFGTGSLLRRESRLAAAIFYLVSPLGFVLSRLNVTDGLLTFFFTATVLVGRATILRREAGRPTGFLSALTGLMAAGAMLSKGLVGILLPGAILFFWCLATGRLRFLRPLVLGPAVPVFLLLAAPWFLLAEERNPGFLNFFFIHEHLLRFTTGVHRREGAPFYFLAIFIAGFLPGLPFLASAFKDSGRISQWHRRHPEAFFLILWLCVVVFFFSLSRSKLPPYILPAFPAAAALAARAVGVRAGLATWRIHALLVALVIVIAALYPPVRFEIASSGLLPLALAAAALLVAGALGALVLARRLPAGALAAVALGWAGFYACLAVASPRVPMAVEVHDLAGVAKEVVSGRAARIVFYNTFLNGVVWELKSTVPIVDNRGEFQARFAALALENPETFWKGEKFWNEWSSGKPLLAIVRGHDMKDFDPHGGVAQILARGRGHFLVANQPLGAPPIRTAVTSAGLYTLEPGEISIPLGALPPGVVARATRESDGARIVWANAENRDSGTSYELVTSGRRPRAIGISSAGNLNYVEEEIDPGRLPPAIRESLRRAYPDTRVAFATRESKRVTGPEVLYEVYLLQGDSLQEIYFEVSGRIYTSKPA